MNARAFVSAAVCIAALVVTVTFANAQSPAPAAMGAGQAASLSAKITAIDKANRIVTLVDASGDVAQVECGPEVKRFNELKLGQTVTIAYAEALVLAVAKADPNAPVARTSQSMTRATGANPGGTVTEIQSKRVTVTAIDANAPSITVKTPKGRIVNLPVKDKNNLKGLKVGDIVDVTYGQQVTISVK